jgi:filamentous hemagglutinin family protein
MNNSYKLVYSETLNTWVAVAEHVSARGKKSAVRLVTAAALLAGGALGTGWALAAPPLIATPAVNQLPTGAQVTTGTVNISQTQTATAANMAIQQSSNQAIVNWQSFNVGANAKVNITQPSSTSVLLNRVMDSNPSQIFGQVNANGQVFLSNPNGVYFAPGSSVDVGSFTATTHSISDADFLAGKYNFNRNGATGSIANEGSIASGLGGYIALLAPEVRNQGVVVAKVGGTVAMAAGESYQLQFNSNNQLTNVLVTPSTLDTLVENGNLVQAPGGLIILSAQAASSLLGGVVKNSGSISATGLVNDGGTIRLSAGNKIELASTSSISADAAPNSAGNGGRIDIITDLNNATGITKVDGSISAKGGELGGDGGFVDTSAARLAIGESTLVTTGASKGKAGTWLLDPYDVSIEGPSGTASGTTYGNSFTAGATSTILASSISSSLNAGSNVSISTGSDSANTIYVNSAITATTGTATLSLTGGTINLAANISTVGSQTYSGAVVINNASGVTLSSTNSNINFGSTVNSSTGNYYGLTVSNGTGTTAFGGVVGGTNPLGYLCINVVGCSATSVGTASSSGTTTLAGNVTTSGTQTYGGNLTIGANTSLTSTANGGNGAVTIAGNVNTLSTISSGILKFLGSGYWAISTSSGSTWAYYLAGSNGSNTYQSTVSLGNVNYTSTLSALSSLPTISYGSGAYAWTPALSTTISLLVVGGGGSGGESVYVGGGGGGGGGGVIFANSYTASNQVAITVGAGGAAINNANGYVGNSGQSSTFGSLTALGGGGGGIFWNSGVAGYALAGGSGGGGMGTNVSNGINLGAAAGGSTTVGTYYANAGGNGLVDGLYFAGGGGGAGSAGGNATSTQSGAGGSGYASNITGTTAYYGAGGGGAAGNTTDTTKIGLGGSGVGGNGSVGASATTLLATSGVTNTGSGGGGSVSGGIGGSAANKPSGAGGSGIVVLNGNIVNAPNTYSLNINSGTGKASIGGSVANVSTLTINSNSSLSEIAGVISGSTALTKSGTAGVLTLSANNTYSGGTTISAGTLQVGAGGSSGAISGNIVNNATLTFNRSDDLSYADVISGTGALSKLGTGALTLSGTNTYSGATSISAGTLKAASGAALGTGAVSVGSTGILDLTYSGTVSLGSTLSMSSGAAITNSANTSNLSVTGASTLAGNINTAGNQTYTGAVTLSGNTTLTTLNSSQVNTNGTITFGAAVDGTASGAQSLTITSGTGAVSFGSTVGGTMPLSSLTITGGSTSTGQTTTLGGNVTTSGNQSFGGNLTLGANASLTSTANSGNGAVTINGSVSTNSVQSSGTVQFLVGGNYKVSTDNGSTWNSYTATSSSSGGSGLNITYSGVSSGTAATANSSGAAGVSTYIFNANSATSYNYLLLGGGGGGGTYAGGGGGAGGILSGAITLSTTNYYITVGNGGAGGSPTTISNGQNGGASGISGAMVSLSALGGGAGGAADHAFTGGSGGGAGCISTCPFPGANGTIGQGSNGGAASNSGAGANGGSGAIAGVSGGGGGLSWGAKAGDGGSGSTHLIPGTSNSVLIGGGGGGGTYTGTPGAGGAGGGGAGAVSAANATSASANTGGGGGGTWIGLGGAGGSGFAVINGVISNVTYAYSLSINSGTGASQINGSVSNLSSLSINSTSASNLVSGAISGSSALSYNTAVGYTGSSGATGVLNLAGTNTYTGGTTVSGGTLQAGSTTAFGGASGAMTVNTGSVLDLNGKTLANANSLSLNGTGISGGGALTNSSNTAATYVGAVALASDSSIGSASGDITVSGIVNGTGSLTKSGTDTLTLSGTNTFNGATSITSGTLAISNAAGLGGTSNGTTVASGATLDLRGASVGAEAVTLSGGTLTASTGTSSLSGAVNLTSASSLSGAGALTLSGAITSNGNGLALIGTGAKTLSSTSNTLSTIATGSGVGVLNVVNNAALAIGQVTAGGSTYSGINSTGTVSVTTRTGDLTVSQNVVTTSIATSYTTPAIKLGAGSLAAAGTPTGGDVLLSGTPSISVGTGGVALIYSGYATTSAARTLANSFAPKLSYYSINTDSTYVPTSFAAAYFSLFRESPTTLYTLYVPGQTFTYGTPITSLNYCYSTSASSCAPVTATGVPSTTQAQAFNNLLLDAGTYPGTIAPAPLEITGYFFAAGNAVNIVVNPKAVTIANVASTTTYDGLSTYTNVANAMTYNVSGLVGSDAVRSITQTPSNSVVAGNVANAGTFAVTPSAAVLSIGRASNYTFNYTSALATVSKANLTVKVKDDAKFVGESDNAAYDGVSYSGFVAGQTASVLSGAVAISRSNASVNSAGTYSGVLSAASSTLSSNNYNINYASGNYTIVPADQLLIRLADTSTTYGTAPTYTLSSVQYKSSTGGAVVDLTSRAVVNTSAFTLADGAGGNTALTLGPLSSSLSSAGQVAVGNYQVGASSITNTSANYSNTVNIVGSLSVGQKSLTVAATSGLSKTYDGTTNMTGLGLGLTGLVGADAVSASGLGTYDNANAGNNKSFDVSGISLSGADAANYKLASNSLNASTGVITAAPLLITANNDSKTYDAAAYTTTNAATAGVNYSGFVNGETASVLSGTLSYGGTAIGAVNVGNYAIAPTGQTSSNYAITYGNGALNISPADVRVSATNVTLTGTVAKVYDGTTVATLTSNNYVTTGWQGSDGATITQTTGTYDNANAGTNKLVNVTLASSDYSATNGTLLSNYNLPTAASGYVGVITPKPVTVSNASRTTTYDGLSSYNALAAGTTYTVGAMVGSDTVSSISQTASGFSGGASGTAQAGTYTIMPSAAVMGTGSASNYSFSYVSSNHTVNKATLNLAISKTYDGSTSFSSANANTYTFTGMVNSESAPTISAGAATTSNADVNTYNTFATNTLALSSGNYTLTGGTVAATITPKPVTVTNTARSTTYDGVTSYTTLATGTTYTVGSMVGSDSVASITQTPTGFSGASTGTAQAGTLTVTPSDAVLGTGSASNYSFSYVPSTHTVDKANLSVSATPSLTGNVYNGTAFTGTYTTTAVNGETFTVAGMASGTNAGTYTSALSVSGPALVNYNTPVITNANLVINPTPLSVTANNASKTYDGTVFSGGSGVTYSGFVNNETSAVLGGTLGYAGTSQNAKNVGNYAITPNGLTSTNYTVSFVDGSLTINPAGLNAIVASLTGSTSKVYDGNTAATLTPGNFAFSGFAAGEGASVSKTAGTFDNANAGTNKTVTVSLSSSDIAANSGTLLSNYTLPTSASGTIGTITKAPLSVTASNASKTYDGAAFLGGNGVTYSGFVNNETTAALSGTLGYAGSSQNAKNVGNYVITPNGLTGANYSVNFVDGSLTINPAGLNAIVASLTGSTSKVYDGNTTATLTPGNFAFSGFATGEGASVSKTAGTYDNANAGTNKTVTVSLSSSDIAANSGTLLSNYTLPTSASGAIGTINKAPLSVTASNASKTYDGAAFLGGNGVTYSGFVNNETTAALSGTLGYAGSSQNAKNVGNYVITPNGLTSANYTVSFVDGSLTINHAGLNAIMASLTGSTSKVYDGNTTATLTPGNFAFSGFATGEGASVSKTAGTFDNANAGSNKTVTVTLSSSDIAANSGTLLSNYTLPTSASGAIGTISKAPLSAALTGNSTKVYDGNSTATLSASNYVISGFANAEGASVSQTNGSFTDKNVGTSKGVTTVISINDIAANNGTLLSNYTLPTSASGNIGTITPANLTLTALTNTKNFDGKNDALAVPTASGLIGSDTVSGLVEAYSDVNPGTGKTLSVQTGYQISDGNSGNNYKVTLVPDQTGEIRAQAVAVLPPAAASASTTYAPPTLTVYAASGASTAAGSAPATSPTPSPAATSASSPASSSSSAASSSVAAGSSSGVVVSTINSPTTQVTGLVAVLVPAGTATAGTGLVIALPEQVLTTAAPNSAVQVTLPNNEPLPSWIRYDAATQTLVTTAVPSGAFPLSVVVTTGGQSTLIQISESKPTP